VRAAPAMSQVRVLDISVSPAWVFPSKSKLRLSLGRKRGEQD